MTINAALLRAAEKLKNTSSNSWLDSEVILAHLLNRERSWLLANPDDNLAGWRAWQYARLINKRAHGEPVAYITGTKEFYGHIFKVNQHTLIPRPETELLVDIALGTIRANGTIRNIIDIGTGSGCIGLSLALAVPKIKVIAVDISTKALKVAQNNANQHKLTERIYFLQGNLLIPVINKLSSMLSDSLIVANLPYLKTNEIIGDLLFEPAPALDGGADGLKYYHELLTQLADLPFQVRPKKLLLELHSPTSQGVIEIIKNKLPDAHIEINNDLTNLPRLTVISL